MPSERAIESGNTGTGRFVEDVRNWTRIASYETVIRRSRRGAHGLATMRLYHDHVLEGSPTS